MRWGEGRVINTHSALDGLWELVAFGRAQGVPTTGHRYNACFPVDNILSREHCARVFFSEWQ